VVSDLHDAKLRRVRRLLLECLGRPTVRLLPKLERRLLVQDLPHERMVEPIRILVALNQRVIQGIVEEQRRVLPRAARDGAEQRLGERLADACGVLEEHAARWAQLANPASDRRRHVCG
jgi:hypothetical protein